MDTAETIVSILIVSAVLLSLRVCADKLDRENIRQYIKERDGTVLDLRWQPFGPGWAGSPYEHIYRLRYLDREGNEHRAFCKSGLFSPVYLTDDITIPKPPGSDQFPGERP